MYENQTGIAPWLLGLIVLRELLKYVLGAVVIRNGHNDAVSKANGLRLLSELLKRRDKIGSRLDENKLAAWVQERSGRFQSGLMTAFLA